MPNATEYSSALLEQLFKTLHSTLWWFSNWTSSSAGHWDQQYFQPLYSKGFQQLMREMQRSIRGNTKKVGKGEICSRAWRPCFSTCKAEVPKLCGKYLLTTAKNNKLFKDKKKVETTIENRDWCQSKQKMAVFLGTGGRQNRELFQNYNHFRARHHSMSESKQRAANVYPGTVCPYWCHIHAILTVGNNNPIDTGAAVPTLEEIQGANLIFILPAATHSILLWAARSLYYLLKFWGKKGEAIIPISSLTFITHSIAYFSKLPCSPYHPLQPPTCHYHPFSSGPVGNSRVRQCVHWKHLDMVLSTAVNVPLGHWRQRGAWSAWSQSFAL